MARYRIDADPLSQTGFAADDAAYLLTWSAGLVVASVAYLVWMAIR